ncbi:glutathione S-transferase N-terminal domain-containing protein [Nannocystis sp.]|uniref:glutathione S-transferase family protein n=1 Tax=Nannocystis sp. TaxID=1962667 RepID=UPI00242998E6|nr:glutathione S-transferase N-terminal domain-containing protein [Nannocystis sp.]MBK7823782.1 glutathione S-transferase N-terminal domain-containing protein [Nannocystis sp.]MBK9755698.1 glutathione S-transferase N-terminal domain-containing protein [Nannocystis sp.]
MKVYGHPGSTCTRKVLTTLAEKGQAFEFVTVDIMKGQGRSPEHLARQPWGQVPVFEADDGWQLIESRAIIRHLDATLPGTSLTPADPREKAKMDEWLSIEQSNFTPSVMKILGQLMFARWRGEEPQMSIVEDGRVGVRKAVAELEKRLTGRDYLAGPGGGQFSLAEISFMPYIEYLFMCGEGGLISEQPNTAAWWARISERDSWQKIRGKLQAD